MAGFIFSTFAEARTGRSQTLERLTEGKAGIFLVVLRGRWF
jgi:hypothetical protein